MSSTEIELRQNGHVAERDTIDGWVAVVSDVINVANLINDTDFVPAEYRGNGPAVAAAILTGRELGIGPMMSLRHVQIVKGVPTLSAEYKRARVLAAGHDFEVEEHTTQRCRVRGRRAGTSRWLTCTFTMDDAKTAGLLAPSRSGKPGAWQTRPRRMLFARAGSELCDFIFADVVNGLPTAELVADGAEDDEFAGYNEAATQAPPAESNGRAAQPAARTAQRRSRASAAQPAPPSAPPASEPQEPDGPPLPGEDEGEVPTSGGGDTSATAPGNGGQSSEPSGDRAEPGWVGLIVRHFERMGVEDRGVRLGYTAQIAGLDALASTKNLTPEQAKAVLDTLARCKDQERLIVLLDKRERDARAGGSDG